MKWSIDHKNTNFKLLSVTSIICLLLPVILLITNPVELMAKYRLRLSVGSLLWNIMQNDMEAAYVRCYLFNVTNADAFLSGDDEKLKVAEVGPFTYQEFRKMEDQEMDEAEGVMRFTLRTYPRFVPERSIADPRDINVTSPNMISLAVASKVSGYPYLAKAGFSVMMNSIKSKSIINESAYNLLWGFNDPLFGVGRTWLPFIDYNSLGILNRLFDTKLRTRIEMITSGEDKFRVKSVNDLPGLMIRGYGEPSKRSKCNTYENIYEGIGFPTDLDPEKPVRLFRDVLCRLLDLEYVGTERLSYGPLVLKYRLDKRTYSTTNDTQCLCSKFCIDGLTDMSPCFYDLSVALSNAQFLDSNPKLYERIEGIHPDENRHGSEILIDSLTGMTLKTKFSLQVNVVTEDLSFNKNFKSFSNMVVPIAYFEVEQPEVPEETKKKFYLLNNVGPYLLIALEAILVVVGAGILSFVLYMKIGQNFMPDRNIAYHLPRSIVFEKIDRL